MRDIIFCASDYAAIKDEAERLGFLDGDGNVVVNGVFSDGGGWYVNLVGTIYDSGSKPRPGYWGRLHFNGDPKEPITFSDKIDQYLFDDILNGWSKDGATLAPTWIADIGVIA